MCIQCGPSGNLLEEKYANANGQSYQDDVGQAVASIAAKYPDGMLGFVPSHSQLHKLAARWKETGEMDSISRHKKMFIESQGDSNYSFACLLAQYKEFLGNGTIITQMGKAVR
ncbi:Fanconi anemia group J protein [Coemansia sp. RSA 2559]|nr:Fanconi anemia group J protein [Coemansia sp. RSA 2559]